ncbi:UNVERIFIED_CONTAM: Agamous-like MADS-box protein [Sesamum calycinum]|uniref:Agamous-like MADS-box protein n=1 Tax=Sesamum calycinum TaxID=2727403 RepID=A0AAW2SXL6_9LAMI
MTRKKVTLAYITNDSERKASFKKRKKGLIKKVSELSTLCGVDACAIIYSQYDQEPEVWPSPLGAQAVLARFRKLSEMDQTRKMVNQESFTRQRIKKAEDQLRRVQKENKRKELENFMFQCLAGMATLEDFNLRDAAEMGWVVNQTLREINSRMETLQKTGQHHQPAVGRVLVLLPIPFPPGLWLRLPLRLLPLFHQCKWWLLSLLHHCKWWLPSSTIANGGSLLLLHHHQNGCGSSLPGKRTWRSGGEPDRGWRRCTVWKWASRVGGWDRAAISIHFQSWKQLHLWNSTWTEN